MAFLINPYRYAAAGGGSPWDPDFADVVFLSGFEGTDGSQPTDLDESSLAQTNTWYSGTGTGRITTDYSAFGSSSFEADRSTGGSTDMPIFTAGDTDFAPGSGDYTWETWFYVDNLVSGQSSLSASSNQHDLASMWRSNTGGRGWIWSVYEDGVMFFYSTTGSDATVLTFSGYALSINTLYYTALIKSGTDMTAKIGPLGGPLASLGTQSVSGAIYTPAATTPAIGAHFLSGGGAANGLGGYIDEMRLTKGVAGSITVVPTAAFPRS